jgi:hypothetical protein
MKVGDMVRYRNRIPTDPPPPGSWGRTGVIIELTMDRFREVFDEPAVEYMSHFGDFIVARRDDLEVISEVNS